MAGKVALLAAFGMQAVSGAAAHPARDPSDILIVGGVEAERGEFPSIVSLSDSTGHFCGGRLLNAKTVITAAHCPEGMEPTSVKVRAGSLKWASGGTQVGVSEIIIHPDYDPETAENDFALLHLKSPIEKGETIGYATLPDQGSDPVANSTVTVAGWGVVEEGSVDASPVLMKVDVPVVSRKTCKAQYSESSRDITDAMFCAGEDEGGQDSCQMDSGGPVYDKKSGVLNGAVSWGRGCGQPGFAGVYARAGKFIPWIAENILSF